VIQFNLFTITMPHDLVRSEIYIVDRATLYAGGTVPYTLISDPMGFTQVPALTYDMAQNHLFLVEDWNSGLGALRLLRISGAVGSETLTPVGFPTSSSWNFAPPVADHAPQHDPTRVATNDSRIQNRHDPRRRRRRPPRRHGVHDRLGRPTGATSGTEPAAVGEPRRRQPDRDPHSL
jgi:hypothetical protein